MITLGKDGIIEIAIFLGKFFMKTAMNFFRLASYFNETQEQEITKYQEEK